MNGQLSHAWKALGEQPQIHLEYAEVGPGEQANLSYALASYVLSECQPHREKHQQLLSKTELQSSS